MNGDGPEPSGPPGGLPLVPGPAVPGGPILVNPPATGMPDDSRGPGGGPSGGRGPVLGILIGLLIVGLMGVGAATLGGVFTRGANVCSHPNGLSPAMASVRLADDPCAQANATPTATLQLPTATPVPQPTNTPRPQPTNTPVPPGHLVVSPTQLTGFCINGIMSSSPVKFTVRNTGGRSLTWTATKAASATSITVSPTTGSLGPGASKTISVYGQYGGPMFTIAVAGSGSTGGATVTVICH